MRKHTVNCQVENENSTKYLQYSMNKYVAIYIEGKLRESDFSKEEQLKILDNLIERMKNNM